MVLSVIVPDNRRGMQRMLEHELQNIDSEVVIDDWRSGLEKAQGDFICLLEYDSAVSAGSLARELEPFLNNPRFRKLAMVSPLVEFDDTEPLAMSSFGTTDHPHYPQLTRAGCAGGAVIRRTSLLKFSDLLDNHISDFSYQLSVAFWENGLRVIADPLSIYYTPQLAKRGQVLQISEPTLKLWQRECIA